MTTRKKDKVKAEKAPGDVKTTEVQKPDATRAPGFPIVGIGASAGGLAAFEAFFSGMPALTDPGMAFVLVQHLAPDHTSILTDIIQRCTRMQVFEVRDGMVVQPNCTYIIPPNYDMAFINGTLQLLNPSAPRGHRLPIDFFFRSLAQDQRERAIGIVLSGTGSDGTLGLRDIKAEGGMIMAQNPESTEFDGMPRSAIATGLVDYVLPPAEMPAQLIAYVNHAFGGLPRIISAQRSERGSENIFKKILILLRNQTGHDFSQYKPSTICRRIERRMAVHQITSIDNYVNYLQQTPAEVESLFRDMLIGVTSFFRDPKTFQTLKEQVIPEIFTGKAPGDIIRIWVPGCSSGEEAYSIAILLQERMEVLKQSYKVQIFATDIDDRAIALARTGIYSSSIAADLSPERLTHFFYAANEDGMYHINKDIRTMLLFSEQNLIRDPPFSKLDLISCRNLLIYMGPELQERLISLFHYALKPGGILFLGASETIGEFTDLFDVLDRKARLYRRRDTMQATQHAARRRFIVPAMALDELRQQAAGKMTGQVKLSLRELTEQALLQQLAPTGVLVNEQGDILYLHGRAGIFLELTPGDARINNILKMAREGLERDMSIALHMAARTKEPVRRTGLRVKTNDHYTTVNLRISPVAANRTEMPKAPLYLVILAETAPLDTTHSALDPVLPTPDTNTHILALEEALRVKEEYLQTTLEELGTSYQELKSSNEEMQSVNEELQSTNEELETSKEELQSVNEELSTVNAELQTKLADLSRANNDMNNLLAGTGIGTVFLDHQLRILRFTPAAARIINLILSDVGRPVAHTVANLVGYDRLVEDTQAVLNTLAPKAVEVQTTDGNWYTMRILPYRTLDNVIEGVVITFVDITEIVRSRKATLRLAAIVHDAYDAMTMYDLDGRILAWNPAAVRMYGWSEAEALLMNIRDRIPEALQKEAMDKLIRLSQAEILEPYRTQRLTQAGTVMEVWITATALLNEAGQVYAIATVERTSESKINLTEQVHDAQHG